MSRDQMIRGTVTVLDATGAVVYDLVWLATHPHRWTRKAKHRAA